MEYLPVIIMIAVVLFMVSYTYHRKQAGKPINNKWTSRKFIVVAVALLYTVIASLGFEIETNQIILVDVIAGVYATLQGLIDVKQINNSANQTKRLE